MRQESVNLWAQYGCPWCNDAKPIYENLWDEDDYLPPVGENYRAWVKCVQCGRRYSQEWLSKRVAECNEKAWDAFEAQEEWDGIG